MALTFTGAGTAGAASGASPQAVTTTTSFAVGDYLVALIAYDNSGGGGNDPMTGTITVTPASGSVGASVSAQDGKNDPGSASAGLCCRAVVFPVTGAIASSTSCNVAWSGTLVVRAVVFGKITAGGLLGYRTNSGTGVIASNVAVANAAALVTPSVNTGEMVLCWACEENGITLGGDSDTTNGSWGTVYGASQGTGVSGVAATMQTKVVTATGTQSWTATGNGTNSDWITGAIIFTESPLLTQAAYRFYGTGSESGSTALAAQDTGYTGDLSGGNLNAQVRVRLQETSATAVPSTDDFTLQWEKNASGTWTDVGSGAVVGYNDASLTEAAATTNRLTGGSGSFVAGKVSEDGTADDVGWTASNYTELLYSVTIVAAQVVDNDVLRFRVRRNGATTGMTYTVTPTFTVDIPPPAVTQAAYRFYADGTETGSSALVAQDTQYVFDDSGDINVQLRMRLQHTSGPSVNSTDDWRLQYELNTSGSWINVISSSIDGYPESNFDSWIERLYTGNFVRYGQAFTGNGVAVTSAGFWLAKQGSPTGNMTATIYAHAGTFGSSSIGTGSALATSTAIDVSTLGGALVWVDFTFDGTFTPTAATNYVVAIEYSGGDVSNHVMVGHDISSPTHPGNGTTYDGSFWDPVANDVIFRVQGAAGSNAVDGYNSSNLTDAEATTNRLGSGSGSFVAGKVSEDGLVDNLGWTANNYTELLYSIKLKAAQLVDTDTLKFRVLKNAATTDMTYTVYPEISVDTGGGAVSAAIDSATGTISGQDITPSGTGGATVAIDSATGTFSGQDVVATATGGVSVAVDSASGTFSSVDVVVSGTGNASVAIDSATGIFTPQDVTVSGTGDAAVLIDSASGTFSGVDVAGAVSGGPQSIDVDPATGTFAAVDVVATATGGVSVAIDPATASYFGQDLTVSGTGSTSVTVDPATGTFVGQDIVPSGTGGAATSIDSATGTFTGQDLVASGTGSASVSVDSGLSSFTGVDISPIGSGNASIAVDPATIIATGVTPTVSGTGSASVAVDSALGTFSGVDPAAVGSGNASTVVDSALGTFTGVDVVGTGTGNVDRAVDVASASFSAIDISAAPTGSAPVAVDQGLLTAVGVDIVPSASGNASIAIDTAVLVITGVSIGAANGVVGAVNTGVLTATGQDIVVSGTGDASVAIDTAVATFSPQDVGASATGSVSRAVDSATVSITAVDISVSGSGSASMSVDTASASFSAGDVAPSFIGGVSVAIDTAVLTVTAIDISVSASGTASVAVDTASATFSAVDVVASATGSVSRAIDSALLTASAVDITTAFGGVSVAIDTAVVTITGVSISVTSSGTATVAIDTASLTIAAQEVIALATGSISRAIDPGDLILEAVDILALSSGNATVAIDPATLVILGVAIQAFKASVSLKMFIDPDWIEVPGSIKGWNGSEWALVANVKAYDHEEDEWIVVS